MHGLKLVLGLIWASPVTIVPFVLYIAPLWFLGKYAFKGWDECAWVWTVRPDALGASWLDRVLKTRWQRWAGATLGNVIVMKVPRPDDAYRRTLLHEKEHVLQIMKLGLLQPIVYAINYLVGRFVLRNTNGYYDNIFEIDARRRAGQLIDMVGAIEKVKL